jgi:hypothetical protein
MELCHLRRLRDAFPCTSPAYGQSKDFSFLCIYIRIGEKIEALLKIYFYLPQLFWHSIKMANPIVSQMAK